MDLTWLCPCRCLPDVGSNAQQNKGRRATDLSSFRLSLFCLDGDTRENTMKMLAWSRVALFRN